MTDKARKEKFGQQYFVLASLHRHLALEKDIEVLIDYLIMGQDCVPIIEIGFFLIDISNKNLIDFFHLPLVLFFHFKLRQVIADLFAVPALR